MTIWMVPRISENLSHFFQAALIKVNRTALGGSAALSSLCSSADGPEWYPFWSMGAVVGYAVVVWSLIIPHHKLFLTLQTFTTTK